MGDKEPHTPQHQWKDLTAAEIKILKNASKNHREFADLLIAKFKEKNEGNNTTND